MAVWNVSAMRSRCWLIRDLGPGSNSTQIKTFYGHVMLQSVSSCTVECAAAVPCIPCLPVPARMLQLQRSNGLMRCCKRGIIICLTVACVHSHDVHSAVQLWHRGVTVLTTVLQMSASYGRGACFASRHTCVATCCNGQSTIHTCTYSAPTLCDACVKSLTNRCATAWRLRVLPRQIHVPSARLTGFAKARWWLQNGSCMTPATMEHSPNVTFAAAAIVSPSAGRALQAAASHYCMT